MINIDFRSVNVNGTEFRRCSLVALSPIRLVCTMGQGGTRRTRKIECNLPRMQIKRNKQSAVAIARERPDTTELHYRCIPFPLESRSVYALLRRHETSARTRRYSCTMASLKLGLSSLNETAIVRDDQWHAIGFSVPNTVSGHTA